MRRVTLFAEWSGENILGILGGVVSILTATGVLWSRLRKSNDESKKTTASLGRIEQRQVFLQQRRIIKDQGQRINELEEKQSRHDVDIGRLREEHSTCIRENHELRRRMGLLETETKDIYKRIDGGDAGPRAEPQRP